jgi:signal transduction histidine kinase
VLSHELRSPLNAVIGFSEIIAEPELGKIPVAKYAEYAREIRDSSRHLLSIIDDLLDIARIESSSIEITQESICAEAMFDTVTRSLAPLAEKRGVTLACQQSNVQTMLLADPRLVRQILTNLVTNAIKFTPSGGEVTIGSDLVHNGSVVLWVRDTGIGIAPENVEKIFEPFTQIEGALNRSFEGVGLGLSIAMHLARAHGGDLTVESELGKGTTVRFTVPSWRMTSVRRRVA